MLDRSVMIAIVWLTVGCTPDSEPSVTPPPMPQVGPQTGRAPTYPLPDAFAGATTRLQFVEIGEIAGLTHTQWQVPEGDLGGAPCGGIDLSNGGVAAADYDNDGLVDLFFTVYDGPDRLYRNLGDARFEEVGQQAGVASVQGSSGAAWLDVDADGDLDLAVGRLHGQALSLYVQQPDGTFVDEGPQRQFSYPELDEDGSCHMIWSLSVGDADQDGDLDLLTASWWEPESQGERVPPAVWLNDGKGGFSRRDLAVPNPTFAMSASFVDVDSDGVVDIPIAGDFSTSRLMMGTSRARWTDRTQQAGVSSVQAGMGSALLDLDGDGDRDWVVTAVFDDRPDFKDTWASSGNHVYINQGDGTFADKTDDYGLRDTGWGWGVAPLDADLDGHVDLAITNGWTVDDGGRYLYEPFLHDETALFLREHGQPAFQDHAADVGLVHDGQGRGLIAFDVENDGDQDLLLVQAGDRPLLWRNELQSRRSWLRVKLQGPPKNPRGIGARVRWTGDDGVAQHVWVHQNSTWLAQAPAEAHFGLGYRPGLGTVRVNWPDGHLSEVRRVHGNQVLVIDRAD